MQPARIISNRAFHLDNSRAEWERAVHCFETVIENAEEESVRESAILGITQALGYLNRRDEVRKYAALLPDPPAVSKESVLENCLQGEELRKYRQEWLDRTLHKLLILLEQCTADPLEAVRQCEDVLHLLIPDGNYLEYHCNLAELAYRKAGILTQQGQYAEAMEALQECRIHAMGADMADEHSTELQYTAPCLDLLTLPPNTPEETILPTYTETFFLQLQDSVFDPLRERDDFAAIMSR